MTFTKDMTVNQAIDISERALQILNSFNIDTCCGGTSTIEAGAKEVHVDVEEVLRALNDIR